MRSIPIKYIPISSLTLKVRPLNLKHGPYLQGRKMINPSGGYSVNIRFLANERRSNKSEPITVKFTRGPRIFLHTLLCTCITAK